MSGPGSKLGRAGFTLVHCWWWARIRLMPLVSFTVAKLKFVVSKHG
jgi:hypothetical protein